MLLRAGAAALLTDVVTIARNAGDAILRIERDGAGDVRRKHDESMLTQADLVAESLIARALAARDPQTPIISEEGRCDAHGGAPSRFWLVDPLDGTREFIAGNGEYTVNIALVEDGEAVLGVVHAPALETTYAAARGLGAQRIAAGASQPIRARAGGELVVVASRSHPGPLLDRFLAALPPHRTVAMGSALKLCAVADGTALLYPRLGPTCWWDTAAAHAVVAESGATVVALDNAPLRYAGSDVRNPPFVCSALPRSTWERAAEAVGAELR